MNATKKFTMTGSMNTSVESHKLLETVPPVSKSPDYKRIVAISGVQPTSLFIPHTFTPPADLARDGVSLRMLAPQVQISGHYQQNVPVTSTSSSLYHGQASRSASHANFCQDTSPLTALSSGSTSADFPELQYSYARVDQFDSIVSTQVPGHIHLPHSSGFLEETCSSPSPCHLISQTTMHPFQPGRSILISRSPESLVIHSGHKSPCPANIRIQLSPILTHILSDGSLQRKSTTPDSTSEAVGFDTLLKESGQPTTYLGYRLPTGKEGSLKHRILRPPSINITDPPISLLPDAPLSAPPIRNHREPSPKQPSSTPSSGYRSFSSSTSSLTETSIRLSSCGMSPCSSFQNQQSFISSGSVSPGPPMSPTTAQLKYPQSFMKGAIIQLANNQLKQVENMTTEDFMDCGLLSPTLRIDSSTVVTIEKTSATGAAKLGFQVGQDNLQITVEAPLEHPFFVYKQGWSSCSPERSFQRYGLDCHKLQVGDTCISLTDKPMTVKGSKNAVLSSTQSLCFPPSEKQTESKVITAKSEVSFLVRKRKRRWSAPDNVPQDN